MSNQVIVKNTEFQFNIRSFHPEKDFGWTGLKFEGDNRSFSNLPSGNGYPTSRIWHRFTLHTDSGTASAHVTRSDPSKAPWSNESREYDGVLAPKGSVNATFVKGAPNGVSHFTIKGKYGGVNHAMPGSPFLQKKIGVSYVPTLDVNYQIKISLDRTKRHVDIVIYVSGDAFPNCEAFVVDSKGHSVFLGVHVRKGAAPVSLSLNLNYPMIACAVRLPIDSDGNFEGKIGDEIARRRDLGTKLTYHKIEEWNHKLLQINPNHGHCMALEKASLDGCFQ
ncbi:MAG: hypothetical protein COB27_010015 [Moritella sp.]|uniref:hypothetical protein n=1 Tax=Moritella sp. TaxID=78556 RepID=UPI000C0DE00D|nr:hypothetical protein [Moritella sp.]MBL1417199.1 hypothetical protein [Moritella sp.]